MDKELRDKRIIELYTTGNMSINRVAQELSVSWGTVKKVLKDNDVEIRKQVNQYSMGNNISDSLFAEINDADSAYWLGFLYADGSIKKDRNEIALELKESDIDSIKDFHSYCGNNNNIRRHVIKRDGKEYVSYASSFSNGAVKENLCKLGCVPRKSLILTCPTEEQVPNEYFLDFLRGYIDGDGYIQFDTSKHRYRIIICGTKDFLTGVVKRLDMFENTYIAKDSNSNIYTLTISNKENVYNLLCKLYENSKYHLKRKYDIYRNALLGA